MSDIWKEIRGTQAVGNWAGKVFFELAPNGSLVQSSMHKDLPPTPYWFQKCVKLYGQIWVQAYPESAPHWLEYLSHLRELEYSLNVEGLIEYDNRVRNTMRMEPLVDWAFAVNKDVEMHREAVMATPGFKRQKPTFTKSLGREDSPLPPKGNLTRAWQNTVMISRNLKGVRGKSVPTRTYASCA